MDVTINILHVIAILFFTTTFTLSEVTAVSNNHNVTIENNPGCDIPQCSGNLSVNIVYARSQSHDSCLHYLFSTVGPSAPTLLLLKSNDSKSALSIDWKKLLISPMNISSVQGAIKLTNGQGISDVAIYILHQVLEYRDVQNNANIMDPKNVNVSTLYLDQILWNVTVDGNSATFMGTSRNESDRGTEPSELEIKFTPSGSDGRGKSPPRLARNALSAEMEFIVNNLTTNFSNSRLAVLVLVANPGNYSFSQTTSAIDQGTVDKTVKWSIDDEYAPSVFTSNQVLWKANASSAAINFWSWRTVCYTDPGLTRKLSTDVKSADLFNVTKSVINPVFMDNRLLLSYFGYDNLQKINFKNMIVAFGKTDDGYYRDTSYVSWTSLVGFGSPPTDSFSVMVICILFVGIGCPALVVLFGAIYLLRRKYLTYKSMRRYKGQYERINT